MTDRHLSMSERENEVGISIEDDIDESSELDNRARLFSNDPSKMKEQYALLSHENNMLSEKYKNICNKLSHQKETSKQQLLQAETMGMMTKYQLVFVKMETAFAKIFNHNKLRDLKRQQEAFAKFKFNAINKRVDINCGSRVALENIKYAGKFIKIYEKSQRYNMRDAFQTWKRALAVEKSIKRKKEEIDLELDERKNDCKRLERRIREMEEEIEENDKRYNHLYALVRDNKKKISLYENKGRELSNDINQILDKAPKTRDEIASSSHPSQDRITILQTKLANALAENKELNAQLEMTNTNVKSFITEMSSLISTHEVAKMTTVADTDQLFEEESGGSRYEDDQREEYSRPTKKYTPHYNTATQGGAGNQARLKRRPK